MARRPKPKPVKRDPEEGRAYDDLGNVRPADPRYLPPAPAQPEAPEA